MVVAMTERQEVAAKLRELRHRTYYREEIVENICDAISIADPVNTFREPEDVYELLADLIDPTCSIGYTDLTTNTPERGYNPDGYCYCSRCGELDDYFAEMWDTYQARYYEGEPPFRYCPYCGSRVVIPSE